MRNILRFLFWSGRTPRDLSGAIPAAPGGRPDGLPRHLEASVVHKLLEAVRGDCAIDLRDHAMLLLMARLGLRAQEVVAIRLDDIDWGAGQMLVRGKGRQFDRVPLPVDVGEAIVTWLCNARKGNSRQRSIASAQSAWTGRSREPRRIGSRARGCSAFSDDRRPDCQVFAFS